MADPIDELAQRWKQNPSPAATIALCEALRVSPRAALVQQVGEFATQRHSADVTVLVSVARMYTESNRLSEAQAALVAAGKLAPREGDIYRWLGEVLLRRGDADRAEKVIERAIQLGARDPDAKLWLERARVFRPMQATAGARAVAAEVAHATASKIRPQLDTGSDSSTTAVHVRPAIESNDPDDEPTRAGPSPLGPPLPAPAPPVPRAPAAPVARAAPATAPMGVHPLAPPPAAAPLPAPAMPPLPVPTRPPPPMQSPPVNPFTATAVPAQTGGLPRFPRDVDTATTSFEPAQAQVRAPAPSASGEIEISTQAPLPTAPPMPARQGPPFQPAPSPPAAKNGAAPGRPSFRSAIDSPVTPHPRDVLDALALAGVYEPPAAGGAGVTVWAQPDAGPKRKGGPTIIVGMVLFLAATVGVFFFYRHKRAQEHIQAEAILATVENQLHAGKPDTLPDAEKNLAQAFQLESRSPRAALDWARERALVGLMKSGEDVAFEDAMARAKEMGVPEEKYAFAHVASFLFQGDMAGAAAVLPRWDGPAATDAWYSLMAGATLERAGDTRARDRYATAAKLDPEMVVAQVAQARAAALAGDAQEGMRLAKTLRTSLPDRAEPLALVGLAWGLDFNRDNVPAPPELDELAKRADELPIGLKFVPHAIAALRALDKHAPEDARAEISRGLAVTDSPGAAVWLGSIALQLGDESLARKAALAALQLSAVYEPARALAARVALLGDRLDEALKATEDLDATSPQVAVVRAATAYERLDADGVVRAFEALPADTRKLPFLAALDLGDDAIAGKLLFTPDKLAAMAADDDAPWGDLIAMDTALDGGDLPTADKIATGWGKDGENNPLRALRLARLARYETRLDQADALSQFAFEHGTVTPRALWERTYVLVAKGRATDVGPMLAHYPLVLGPLATWLSAYATASGGNVDSAKGRTASLDPPPSSAPLEARVVAAAAFGAMKDKRRGPDYVKDVLSSGSLHPDLVAAALDLGFHKVDHFKKKPTYEQ